MLCGEELRDCINNSLQYDVRDIEEFYTKTKATKLSITLDLDHHLNVAYSSSDLVAEIMAAWLSMPETQHHLKKYLLRKLNSKVLKSLPEEYFARKITKQFETPLHPGSYKIKELREYVTKGWQYLTGTTRPCFANPKKRPKNVPKQIPWKDPFSMSISKLRLVSQWLSYTIDGIMAKSISIDRFRDKRVYVSLKPDMIKGIKMVKKADDFKLMSKGRTDSRLKVAPASTKELHATIDHEITRNDGPRRVSCDVIRWNNSYPAFGSHNISHDKGGGSGRGFRDFRPRSKSNIETGNLERVHGKDVNTHNEPYQPFRTLSFASKSLKPNIQT
ncbi:hypothetical protein K7432_016966, partial [Basidiobolus ranarum]